MPAAVAGQKGNAGSIQIADGYGVAGLAEGGIDIDFFNVGQPFDFIKPAAADDGEFSFWH
ncbi:hypothetical protein ES708_22462 [subsurface metagenome]